MAGKKQRIFIVHDPKDIALIQEMVMHDLRTWMHTQTPSRHSPSSNLTGTILFEYLMPEMNGYEFYRKLKQIDHISQDTHDECLKPFLPTTRTVRLVRF